jgi:DNA polymerase
MKDILGLDYETFSEIDLKKVGSSRYAKHHSTKVLMASYAFNDGPVEQWVPAEGEPIPKVLRAALIDPDVQKWAWNAPFEMQITEALVAEVQIRQWRDTMVMAMSCSLPGKLEKCGPVIGLDDEHLKDSRGALLIRKFSMPRKPTKENPSKRLMPEDDQANWQLYKDYNIRDTIAERAIRKRLWKYRMSEDEWDLWFLDQKINQAGVPINMTMVGNAIRTYEIALKTDLKELAGITGLDNPNSGPQLLPWLKANGYMFDDLKKGHIKTALGYFKEKPEHWTDEDWQNYRDRDALKESLQLRRDTSRTSIKKFYALQRSTDLDGNLRYTLQMNGAARTGRFAGRIYQPQNLPRPEKEFEDCQGALARAIELLDHESLKLLFGNPFNALASSLRPTAQAPDGLLFVDADLSAIENRVLGWLAACDKILDVFRKNLDPYISFATYLYDQPYDVLWHEYKVLKNGLKRTIAKPGTLGCGYGMGAGEEREDRVTGEIEATGLLGYAWGMGIRSFTKEDSKLSVDTFRREFKEVKDYWYAIERAAKRCVRTGQRVEFGVLRFEMDGPFLKMVLPSERPLRYLRPKIELKDTPWGEKTMQLTYEGVNDRKQWMRMHTTPGKLTENADQAISRDILVHGLKLANKEGLDIRLHVHDQILALVKESEADEKLVILKQCMEEQPKWAPGLPLGSAGLTTKFFVKD